MRLFMLKKDEINEVQDVYGQLMKLKVIKERVYRVSQRGMGDKMNDLAAQMLRKFSSLFDLSPTTMGLTLAMRNLIITEGDVEVIPHINIPTTPDTKLHL